MARIVVVGAGIGGVPAAYELKARLGKGHEVTLVNASDYFQFVPSNPWVAVGTRTRDAITVPLRPHLEKKGIAFVAQAVTAVQPERNTLQLLDGSALEYDYLVLTTGPGWPSRKCPAPGRSTDTPIRSVRPTTPSGPTRLTRPSCTTPVR